MKLANLIVAILYTLLFVMLFIVSLGAGVRQADPYRPVGTIFFIVPVVVNWMSFAYWNQADSKVRMVNVVFALVYSTIFVVVALMALSRGDGNVVMGVAFIAVPVVLNWLSYIHWPHPSHGVSQAEK